MKPLAFFMAFLVLALSCLPCADGNMQTAVSIENVKPELAHNQQGCDDHEDACSPFCHCICCASFSINHIIPLAIIPIPPSSINHSAFYISAIAEFSVPIWQPPQLS